LSTMRSWTLCCHHTTTNAFNLLCLSRVK
jgi:hypothetical protein